LMHDFLAQSGKNGLEAKAIRVPGASKAVLVTLPPSASQGTAKDLFAAYARGVIQVDMTAPLTLPDTRPIAILNLVART
jgi:predicted dinucleotide-binding enzyme